MCCLPCASGCKDRGTQRHLIQTIGSGCPLRHPGFIVWAPRSGRRPNVQAGHSPDAWSLQARPPLGGSGLPECSHDFTGANNVEDFSSPAFRVCIRHGCRRAVASELFLNLVSGFPLLW